MVETMRLLKEHGMEAERLKLLTGKSGEADRSDRSRHRSTVPWQRKSLSISLTEDVDPEVYVEEHGLKTVNDEGALKAALEQAIANNPKAVADYKGGKEKALGALVGQTMKAMRGKANPGMINQMLREMLK